MSVQIAPFLTLSQQFFSLLEWDGDLVVRTLHGKKSYRVPASEIIDLTEAGILISWRGKDATGTFLPWGEVIAIDQVSA